MERSRLNREFFGVLVSVTALLIIISLLSYAPRDPSLNTSARAIETQNRVGIVGAYLADILLQGFGLASYLLPIFLSIVAFQMFRSNYRKIPLSKFAGYGVCLISIAVILDLFIDSDIARESGGIIGGFLKESVLIPLFGRVSTILIAATGLLASVMLLSEHSLFDIAKRAKRSADGLRKMVTPPLASLFKEVKEKREKRKGENTKKEHPDYVPPPILVKEEISPDTAKKTPRKTATLQEQYKLPAINEGYKLPTPDLLDPPAGEQFKIDKETLHANSLILQKKLADFGVEGEVVAVRPGPVITMYEFKPAPGVKVRRIVLLADDLAMALRAVSVRILAPIPGESVVGIEIPNPRRETVFLREVIESKAFQSAESKLTFAMGKDIGGTPFVTDLARMPHLLVAGATGTGKSVSINAMILSILFKSAPQDVKFIMIDPKMLELTVYEEIPQLLVPVVTDPKKAAAALFWAMDEMDRRYRLMREKGARNIDNYKLTQERESAGKKSVIELTETQPGEETTDIGGKLDNDPELVHERLPRIVIIVDELADLMMTVGRDIEEYITRLAQKARAAGIHLILATQRPSVDVITGLIKANFPARISFQVTSRVDSRTILDAIGAERLLGEGDMLFLPPGTARVQRLHGSFVSDGDVHRVVEFIKGQEEPRYEMELLEGGEDDDEGGDPDAEDMSDEMYDDVDDDLYQDAIRVVCDAGRASTSTLQRRLRIGYGRAARLIDLMEKDG